MFCVVSPAKKLDFDTAAPSLPVTQPVFLDDTVELSQTTRDLSRADLSRLMKISETLADLNHARFQGFSTPFDTDNAKAAALAFSGDTYVGLDAASLSAQDFDYAQDHFGILSGFYGLLRPLDAIQAYRLEMGSRLKTRRGKSLYDYWRDQLAKALTAPRGPQWICGNCHHIHSHWTPVCDNCGAFDTLAWKDAPAVDYQSPTGTAMLPLIVGELEDKRQNPTPDPVDEPEEALVIPDEPDADTASEDPEKPKE